MMHFCDSRSTGYYAFICFFTVKRWQENRNKSPFLLYRHGDKKINNIYSKKKKKIHSWTTFIAAMLATQNDFKD